MLVVLYFYFIKKEKQVDTTVEPANLTDVERIQILDSLSAQSETSPVTETGRVKILKDLNTKVSDSQSLTETDRTDILNSLNQ